MSRRRGIATVGAALACLSVACSDQLFNVNTQIDTASLPVPEPQQNPTTLERAALGKLLFWDPILAGEKDVACATCHHPDHGYADGLALALGVGAKGLGPNRRNHSGGRIPPVHRNTPTIINAAFAGATEDNGGVADATTAPLLWDGRLESLEVQALAPIADRTEMRGDAYTQEAALDSVVARLEAIPEYVALFAGAFPDKTPAISAEHVGQAIAAFERTLVATDSRFDRYVAGDQGALTQVEKRGLLMFVQVGCYRCHSGPMMSDYLPHTLGVAEHPDVSGPDAGNGAFAFRTPTLRNLSATAPYMHNGTLDSLEDVVRFYEQATSHTPHVEDSQLDPAFNTIGTLPDDAVNALVAFLRTMDDNRFDRTIPDRVPSGLPVGGAIH